MMTDWFTDLAVYRLRLIQLEQDRLELRFNPNHDEKTGRFTTSPNAAKGIDKKAESGIIKERAAYRKKGSSSADEHYISREKIDKLTVEARKNGAVIIVNDDWFNKRMLENDASAITYGDVIAFGKNVTVSDVLEETYHFKQNLQGLNDDKPHDVRELMNEIDAKKYLLSNARKYKIPRGETELTKKQLESYERRLKNKINKKE